MGKKKGGGCDGEGGMMGVCYWEGKKAMRMRDLGRGMEGVGDRMGRGERVEVKMWWKGCRGELRGRTRR